MTERRLTAVRKNCNRTQVLGKRDRRNSPGMTNLWAVEFLNVSDLAYH